MPEVTPLPEPSPSYGSDLYNSLPSFWTRMYDDSVFISRMTQGFGMNLEQLKIEMGEAEACLGRETVPPYARTKAVALSIRKSEKDGGRTTELHFGMDPLGNVGPQPDDSPYVPNSEFHIGGSAPRRGYVSYPIHGVVPDDGVLVITDRLSSPYVVFSKGVDYYLDGESIVFREDRDPFSSLSRFFLTGTVESSTGEPDQVLLMWGMEALYDKGYVEDHFGQLYDGTPGDPSYYKDVINAAGDLYSKGTAENNVRFAMGRLFQTAVVEKDETVVDVQPTSTQTLVVTADNMYRVRVEETLRPEIVIGYALTKGEFLTESVRVYQTLNPNVFEERNGLTLEQFKLDFPELHVRPGMAAVGGLALVWDSVPVLYRGKDEHGNNRYSFNVSSSQGVDDAFWNYVFDRTEAESVKMSDLLSEFISPGHAEVDGEAVGSIVPVRYFLTNFFSANASAVVVDFASLPQYIRELDVTRILSEVSAVYTRTFVTVRAEVAAETYDLADGGSESLSNLPAAILSEEAGVANSLTYYDATVKTRRVRI